MADTAIRTLTTDLLASDKELGVSVRRMIDHGSNQPHDHVFHEIVYIETGYAEHETAAGRQVLHPGDLIVLRRRSGTLTGRLGS